MVNILREVRALLPQDVTRLYARVMEKNRYHTLMKLREREVVDSETVSLKPFLHTRSVFVHIPKCAGISINLALYGCRGGAHLGIDSYLIAFSEREFGNSFKFTFVRNPWDRLVSSFFFLKNGGINLRDKKDAERYVKPFCSFEDFVMESFVGDQPIPARHFLPQFSYLCLTDHSEPLVNYVGRFENIDNDFRVIANKLGISQNLAQLNRRGISRGDARDYRAHYNDRTAEIVGRAYRRDVELFGYEF